MVNSKGLIAGNDKIGQPNLEEEKKKALSASSNADRIS